MLATLRETVRFLGHHLGTVITEQAGQQLLDLEEVIRKTAREVRQGHSGESLETLISLTSGLEPDTAEGTE